MKVGAAQIRCEPGAVDRNLAKVREYAERAREAGCDVALFPEMVDTGYDTTVIAGAASAWDGAPFRSVSDVARSLELHVVCGLSERSGDDIYNSVAVFAPDGRLLAKYRKTHLITTEPIHEERVFKPGESMTMLEVEGLQCGVMVCYDLRFPEVARTLALRGAQMIFVPSAWPRVRIGHWRTLTECRAIENQLYLVCANRTGDDGPNEFGGASRIVDPRGTVAGAGENEETLVTAEIDAGVIKETRDFMPVFEHRRPDLYEM